MRIPEPHRATPGAANRPASRSRRLSVVLVVLTLLLTLAACTAGGTADGVETAQPRLRFAAREHAFGPIGHGETAEHRLTFTNAGTGPLLIGDVVVEPISRPYPDVPGG